MSNYVKYLEEYDDDTPPTYQRTKSRRPKRDRAAIIATLVEQGEDTNEDFNPSFSASKHERAWILTYLGGFYQDQLIADVLHQVKGGKEATVYCCAPGPGAGAGLIAAKVYRPRMFRNLRNDSLYRLGRNALDAEGKATRARRELLAMRKRTDFGQELLHGAWLANEFRTMQRLYEEGAAVPRPISHSENAILMEYLGEAGRPAQVLHHVALRAEEARPLFDQLIHNIDLMLGADCVHADLSAHNILYWDGAVKIIDFPQAVDPYTNPEAYPLFARDVLRVCQYFAHYGITTDPARLARDLWARHIPTA